MTLSQAKTGKIYRIHHIELENPAAGRLRMLGMTEGAVIKVIGRKISGAVIVRTRGTRLALGRRFAESIFIGGNRSE